MASIIKVDDVQDAAGNNIINEAGDTITIGGSGDTINLAGTPGTGMGKILQAVTAIDSTERSSTSTSFATASSTLTLSITPAATSSKIFVIMTTAIRMTSADGCDFAIYRESTNTTGTSNGLTRISGIQDNYIGMTCSVLDSPSSTSAQTYQLYVKVAGGQIEINSGGRTGTITAFEIGA